MSKIRDRTGYTHGVFTVVEFYGTEKGEALWLCECSNCGGYVVRSNRYFRRDRTPPKSCDNCKHMRNYRGVGDLSMTHWHRIEKQAADRDIPMELTISEAWDLFKEQEGKCYLTGLPLQFSRGGSEATASLDRMSSDEGYSKNNCRWVHKEINIMKGKLELNDFINWCRLVVEKEPNVAEYTGS